MTSDCDKAKINERNEKRKSTTDELDKTLRHLGEEVLREPIPKALLDALRPKSTDGNGDEEKDNADNNTRLSRKG